MFVSLTRLRLRSVRFLPAFFWHTLRANRQVARSAGFHGGKLLADRRWTFWTMTAWDDIAAMRGYMNAGAHRVAMPYLMRWCDEASIAHWTQDGAALPPWNEADRRMRDEGSPSKVLNPSADHATLAYAAPRTTRGGAIRPA